MTRGVLAWAGGVIAAGSVIWLAGYFAVAGFHPADTLGVIGAVVGIAGLVLAVYGAAGRGGREAGRDDAAAGPSVDQRARASGQARVYQAGRDQTINDG